MTAKKGAGGTRVCLGLVCWWGRRNTADSSRNKQMYGSCFCSRCHTNDSRGSVGAANPLHNCPSVLFCVVSARHFFSSLFFPRFLLFPSSPPPPHQPTARDAGYISRVLRAAPKKFCLCFCALVCSCFFFLSLSLSLSFHFDLARNIHALFFKQCTKGILEACFVNTSLEEKSFYHYPSERVKHVFYFR